MSLKSLNDLIKKYEDIREKIDSFKSRVLSGPDDIKDSLFIVDEFIKDLKGLKEVK